MHIYNMEFRKEFLDAGESADDATRLRVMDFLSGNGLDPSDSVNLMDSTSPTV